VAAEGNAKLEVEKLTQLVQNKVVSGYQLKTVEAAYDVAKANTEQARANITTAEINLNYTLIKAPSSGFISRLGKKQGSLVAPGDTEPLTVLSDVQNVHVYFSLGERDFVTFKEKYAGKTLNEKISQLPPVELLLADDSRYDKPGRIDIIDGQFDKTTGAITVRASFPNPNGLLRSGNTGKIRLSLQHKNVLLIPQSATMELQDRVFIYTVEDSNKVKRQSITVIGKSGTNFLVRDGVKPGDKIVISGWEHLQDGEVIQPEKLNESVTVN
jgi:membrane fusion protein (multidrug efflux system)